MRRQLVLKEGCGVVVQCGVVNTQWDIASLVLLAFWFYHTSLQLVRLLLVCSRHTAHHSNYITACAMQYRLSVQLANVSNKALSKRCSASVASTTEMSSAGVSMQPACLARNTKQGSTCNAMSNSACSTLHVKYSHCRERSNPYAYVLEYSCTRTYSCSTINTVVFHTQMDGGMWKAGNCNLSYYLLCSRWIGLDGAHFGLRFVRMQ